jgi:hypothetical protein
MLVQKSGKRITVNELKKYKLTTRKTILKPGKQAR